MSTSLREHFSPRALLSPSISLGSSSTQGMARPWGSRVVEGRHRVGAVAVQGRWTKLALASKVQKLIGAKFSHLWHRPRAWTGHQGAKLIWAKFHTCDTAPSLLGLDMPTTAFAGARHHLFRTSIFPRHHHLRQYSYQPTMPTASTLLSGCRSRREAVDDVPRHHSGMIITLELQRRWRRVKEWYTSSYPTCDTGEYEPSWVLARRANLANCKFYRLPEELILQILGNLDYVSKATALRTCGPFMRIMFDRTLFSHTRRFRFSTDIQVWPPFEQPAWSQPYKTYLEMRSLRKQVDRLLDRDRFCDPCRRFREDGRYEKAAQALQGTLWCSHCDKVHKRPLFSPQQRDASSATRICVLAEGKAPFCAHLSIGWDSTQNVISTREELCRHPDHDPAWYTCLKDSFTNHRSPGYERPCLEFMPRHNSHSLNLWSQTEFLLFRLHRAAPVTRAWLQERLTAKAHVLDKMLCPHITARDGQLLLPFGPDRCACFDCPRRIDHSCSSYHSFCCRCNTTKTSGLAGYFIPGEFNWRHTYRCAVCNASYDWRRCGSAVYLKIDTLSGGHNLDLPVQPRFGSRHTYWLYKIHPESWGILDDEELHHVAWCDDINCTSRWRWERLSRLLEDA